jgi:hypothetical protein
MRLTHLFNEGSNWHTDPEQQSMDATRRARLGREREPEGSDAIDARLAANNNARQQYAETGRFWLKQKDTQQHLNDQPYIGKAAANVAALELLKQQPELRGNLVITAYGPGEQQVTEGRVKELGQDLKDKALSDDDFKKKYSKTRAEVRAAMREKQVVAEAPGAETLGHNQSTVASNLNSLDLGEGSGERVGFSLDSERAYQAVMSRFGDMIDQDQDSGIMYAPERLWPKIEQVAYDADGIGAQRDDELENPEHYGMKEGEKVGNMDADAFDDAMARLKKLAGAGPMRTVYDPAKRVYKNVPVAQQPGDKK